jgi:hypothetical protein
MNDHLDVTRWGGGRYDHLDVTRWFTSRWLPCGERSSREEMIVDDHGGDDRLVDWCEESTRMVFCLERRSEEMR